MAVLRHNKPALSFNDILLVPQYSDIESRLDTDLSTRLTKNITISHPVCSTNMSTVTDWKMMRTMGKSGSAGFLHRFMSLSQIMRSLEMCHDQGFPIVASVGVKKDDIEIVEYIMSEHMTRPNAILIDIAHGHSIGVIKMIRYIKENWDVDIIAGNIATADAAKQFCDEGVDAVRVGIGGSLVCATRTVTGHGMPTLQSIIDCYEVTSKYNVPIIADGGFKTSGDVVKALAFGAESVSLGTMLAATSDSPGEIIKESKVIGYTNTGGTIVTDVQKKKVYGMASKEAQEIHRDGLKPGTAAEGHCIQLDYKGKTADVLMEILGGIRSGLTYSGSRNLKELRENAEYVILGPGGITESKF